MKFVCFGPPMSNDAAIRRREVFAVAKTGMVDEQNDKKHRYDNKQISGNWHCSLRLLD
jgi:hypothetical protein